jgi:PPP family 3-phenylpropionic acid transporter
MQGWTLIMSDRKIIAGQYFVYFGVLGAYLPFFNLYCYHIGLDGVEIGAISAVRSAILVLFSLLWGVAADRFSARRPIYIGCSFAAAGLGGFYLLTEQFLPMLFITVLYSSFYSPVISFLEAFTMDVLRGEKGSYGHIRAWGSISFILMVVVLGRIIDAAGVGIILVVILAGSMLQAAIATRLPAVGPREATVPDAAGGSFFKWRTVFFFGCAFLMLVSHGAYYGFFSIHLETLGFGGAFIGMSWAVASAAEILVMLSSRWIFARHSPQAIIVVSFVVAAARWGLLFQVRSAGGILATQLLHAVTYGAFHMASILYIDALAPDRSKTVGQAVNNGVTYGLGLMVGFFLNGYLYERLGSPPLFLIAAAIALAGGLIFRASLLRQPDRAD